MTAPKPSVSNNRYRGLLFLFHLSLAFSFIAYLFSASLVASLRVPTAAAELPPATRNTNISLTAPLPTFFPERAQLAPTVRVKAASNAHGPSGKRSRILPAAPGPLQRFAASQLPSAGAIPRNNLGLAPILTTHKRFYQLYQTAIRRQTSAQCAETEQAPYFFFRTDTLNQCPHAYHPPNV